VQVNGQWRDVFKDPATDPDKRSKAGRMTLLQRGNAFATVRTDRAEHAQHLAAGWREALRTVYEDGRLLIDDRLADIRQRATS
jgi:nicotinamide phosphoribosyltransferase